MSDTIWMVVGWIGVTLVALATMGSLFHALGSLLEYYETKTYTDKMDALSFLISTAVLLTILIISIMKLVSL